MKRLASLIEATPEFRFARTTLGRITIFVLIALSSVGLHAIVHELDVRGYPFPVLLILSFVAYLILVTDVAWFAKGLIAELRASLTEVFRGRILIMVLVGILLVVLGMSLAPYASVWLPRALQSIVPSHSFK
jgi:uncharacterized membrane protein YiaA